MIPKAFEKFFRTNNQRMADIAARMERRRTNPDEDTLTRASESDLLLEAQLAVQVESMAVQMASGTMAVGHKTGMAIIQNMKA